MPLVNQNAAGNIVLIFHLRHKNALSCPLGDSSKRKFIHYRDPGVPLHTVEVAAAVLNEDVQRRTVRKKEVKISSHSLTIHTNWP